MSRETTDWKTTANRKRTRGLVGTELVALFEVHDDIPIAQHLMTIMRSRGKVVRIRDNGEPVYRDPYKLKDEEFLKELEAYREALQQPKNEDE